MSTEINPYAAPQYLGEEILELESQEGVWEDRLFVVPKNAKLAGQCVKCGAPTDYLLKRKLSWHSPWLFLLILISIWVYAIVALIVRKKGTVYVGLCGAHRRRRRRAIAIAWLAIFAGIGVAFLPEILQVRPADEWWVLSVGAGFLIGAAGALFGVFASRTVWPKKIDKQYLWLKGVSPLFVTELPKSSLAR